MDERSGGEPGRENRAGRGDAAGATDGGGSDTRMTVGDGTTITVDPAASGARLSIHGERPFDAVRAELDRHEAIQLAGALLEAARGADGDSDGSANGDDERDPSNRPEVTTDGGASAETGGTWTNCHGCGFSWTANDAGRDFVDCPRCDTLTTTGTGVGAADSPG